MPAKLCKREDCDQPTGRGTYCSLRCYNLTRTEATKVERKCKSGRHWFTGKHCKGCDSERNAIRNGRAIPEVRGARSAAQPPTPPEGELVWRPQAWGGPIVRTPDGQERPATKREVDRWQVAERSA